MDISTFLDKVNQFVLNPLIILAFGVAFLMFFFGIFQFIASQTIDTERDKGKRKILWGLFGMFIMFAAYGLIRLVLGTFGISVGYPLN